MSQQLCDIATLQSNKSLENELKWKENILMHKICIKNKQIIKNNLSSLSLCPSFSLSS